MLSKKHLDSMNLINKPEKVFIVKDAIRWREKTENQAEEHGQGQRWLTGTRKNEEKNLFNEKRYEGQV